MAEERRQIFRQKSLDRLEAPDNLDQLLRIVRPQAWIALSAVGAVLALAVAWSIVGRVPITVDGVAFLTRPQQMVPFQAPSRAQVESIQVQAGQVVEKDDLLAILRLPDLEHRIELEKRRSEQTRARLLSIRKKERELADQEIEQIRLRGQLLDELSHKDIEQLRQQSVMLEARVESVTDNAKEVRDNTHEAIVKQKADLEQALVLSREALQALDKLNDRYESLRTYTPPGAGDESESEGIQLVSEDQLVDLDARIKDRRMRAMEIEASRQDLELSEIVSRQTYAEQQDLAQDLAHRLRDVQIQLVAIERRIEVRKLEDEGKLAEIQAGLEVRELEDEGRLAEIQLGIDLLESRYENERHIRSQHRGRVIELVAHVGELVDVGGRLGKLEVDIPDARLTAVAFFSIEDGKKVDPDLPILVSPSTVKRARFGSIRGVVTEVSEFPVTTLAAAHQIGDVEIAESLLQGESRIQVMAELTPNEDTYSGFTWSSGDGPQSQMITAGTTAQVRVTVEKRAPITFVLPFLKSLTGS